MSIIVLNDLVLKKTEEGNQINKEICLFYLILNFSSFICCATYLYIYHIIPYYQNHNNTFSLILTRVNFISTFSYALFFADLYIYTPSTITTMIKILTMINPLIIFTFYFWVACITHNIYLTFYYCADKLQKRIKIYKYQLIVYLFILYVLTLFSIKFQEKQISSRDFSFIDNYGVHYIILFYLIGLFLDIYIIYRLYFIMAKKSQTFYLTSPNEITLKKEKLFQSLIVRHILFIFYFLITFVPINFLMILKYIFRLSHLQNFYLSFLTMTLLSLYGTFTFINELTEPIFRHFFLSFVLCDKKYIKEYEPLMRESNANILNEELSDSGNELGEKEQFLNVYRDYDKSFVEFYSQKNIAYSPILLNNKYTSFTLGNNYGLHFMQVEKKEMDKNPLKKLNTFSMENIKSVKEGKKAKSLVMDSSGNYIEMTYYQDEGDNNKENNNINMTINVVNKENIDNKKNENKHNDNNKNLINTKKNNKNILKLDKSVDSISEIKEENATFEETSKTENDINSNKITSNLTTKTNPQLSSNFQRLDSNMNSRGLNTENNVLYKSTHYDIRTSGTFQIEKVYGKKQSTDFKIHNRGNEKLITLLKKTDFKLSRVPIKSKTSRSPRRDECISKKYNFFKGIAGYDSLTNQLEGNENLQRMLAISICINNNRKYDNQHIYQQYYYSPLLWKDTNFYKEETPFIKYNEKNFPENLKFKGDNEFIGIELKVKEYCPFVFHHLRLMDKLSIDDVLQSLDIKRNMDIINDSKVTGGRGNNSMFRTWDKKLIIKTIDEDEKKIFINKMLEEYHSKMRDSKSLLCHIYGVFTIELGDKGESNVILQRNMNDLFIDSNILIFDLKGSTAERKIIKNEHINLPQKILINKYKNQTLKDKDLNIIGIKLELNPFDGKNILSSIRNDSLFLQKYEITDYSLLIFVNKYNKRNLEKQVGNINVTAEVNKKYIFNFSIIDFLGTFNLGKRGEKFVKEIVGMFKSAEDKNFSVQDSQKYGKRFRENAKKIIIYEKEENENDNFSS